MNDSFEYSSDALENKAAFYDKLFTVYVEGDDDVIFWNNIFLLSGSNDFHIECVGCKSLLNEYIKEILEKDLKIIVACDADYSRIDNTYYSNSKILITYGYSIENSMYRTKTINSIIQNLSKRRVNLEEDIDNWKEQFTLNLLTLLTFDYTSYRYNKGIKVLGKNSCRFLVKNCSPKLSDKKINDFITKIKSSFKLKEIKTSKNEIQDSKIEIWYIIRGHFLTNAVLNYIKSKAEQMSKNKVSFTLDTLYAMSVDCRKFRSDFDIDYLVKQVKSAIRKLNINNN